MDYMSSLIGIPVQKLKQLSSVLIGSLGIDSLTATRLRGALHPKPSYQILYGSTVAEIATQLIESPLLNNEALLKSCKDNSSFPLTPMQESYLLGSNAGCRCQVYTEWDITGLDFDRFQKAVQTVVNIHPMLKASIVDGAQQKTDLSEKKLEIKISYSSNLEERRSECIEKFKECPHLHWDIQLSQLSEETFRLHLLLDMLFIDATSAILLVKQVIGIYNRLETISTPKKQFRDYCNQITNKSPTSSSVEYWNSQCEKMPAPPLLPLKPQLHQEKAEFSRRSIALESAPWIALKKIAQELQVSPNAIVLAAFAEVLRLYSEEVGFTLTVTMSERPVDRENDFSEVVGEFTNVILCPILNRYPTVLELATALHKQLAEGLEKSDVGGLEVVRMVRRKQSDPLLSFPVVFTSFLGIIKDDLKLIGCNTSLAFQQTQTPQITLDHQIYEWNEKLYVNWDFDSNVYSTSLIIEMLDTFERLLNGLAVNRESQATLSDSLLKKRSTVNETFSPYPTEAPQFLDEFITKQAHSTPRAIAIIDGEVELSYADLMAQANQTASKLQALGCKHGSCIAILMEKGWEQVVGVLGILLTGAYYLPLDPNHPDDRLQTILTTAQVDIVLVQEKTLSKIHALKTKGPIKTVPIDRNFNQKNKKYTFDDHIKRSVEDLAYVIFTSGSTGEPKGVEIPHKGAVNTCLDINNRLNLGQETVTLGISSLSFDLSVWDIFGTLGAGGTLVICKPDATHDPGYWWDQIIHHRITVWNTVPTSFEMLMAAKPMEAICPIRVALLSGDAIRSNMIQQAQSSFPDLRIIAMGGATEASIWSNYHECFQENSVLETDLIPYGRALTNQTIHVLDDRLQYRPDGVVGEIYIGGMGLAKGYFHDPKLTAEKFVEKTHLGRLYKTGDLGRYLPNGEIEILGRRDSQVKIGGYRIELAEIERCVESLPNVDRAAVVSLSIPKTHLCGFVSTTANPGRVEAEVREAVDHRLPEYMQPQRWVILDQLPLTSNMKINTSKLRELALASSSEGVNASPISSVEITRLLEWASQLLKVPTDTVSISKSLVEQGLSSLLSVQFVNLLSKAWGIKPNYTLIFNYPSILELAEYRKRLVYGEYQPLLSPIQPTRSFEEPIAVISTACRLPGGITSPEEFWSMLISGKDCVVEVPSSRFDVDAIYDPDTEALDKSYTRKGAFLEKVDHFDHDFFGISFAEAKSMDPQQRLLLEVAYEAFVAAGYNQKLLAGTNTGVFIGQMNYDWMVDFPYGADYAGTGVAPSITSNRISFVLDLMGPSMTIDTACSSSLVAVDIAVTKLRSGSCRMAVAGGVNLILSPQPYVTTCKARMLSTHSRCATFDAAADGISRGEGVGAVVLKRLSDAQADGDPILALICGSSVNQDGRSASLTAPSGLAQEAAIKEALEMAKLAGSELDYIECHGTGTALGDPIEIAALKSTFGKERHKPIVLGAVKTNIGHLEGAAGIIGLIKTIEVLLHRCAPPNIHFKSLNPKIDLDDFDAIIPTKQTFLGIDPSRPLVAGISSFGYGGTNAHLILQSRDAVKIGRRHPDSNTLWMFTGQGALEPGSARSLYETDPVFKKSLDDYTTILKEFVDAPLLNLLIENNDQHKDLIQQTQFAQPALVALQLAQVSMWEARAMRAKTLLGHSIGEYAAAATAGVMSTEDALKLAALRGRRMSESPPGGMVAILGPINELPPFTSQIRVAAYNGPSMTVLSGPLDHLHEYLSTYSKEIRSIPLSVSHAFHSPMMTSAAQRFRQDISSISLSPPASEYQFISTLTGQLESERLQSADYWVDQIVEPVRFDQAIKTAFSLESLDRVTELGPASTLINIVKHGVNSESIEWIPSIEALRRNGTRPLFKERLVEWEKPGIKTKERQKESPLNQPLYQLEWEISNLTKGATSLSNYRGLLLSLLPVSFVLPSEWTGLSIEIDSDLSLTLKSGPWSTIAFLSSGSKDDLKLGLRLLQSINSHPEVKIDRILFIIEKGSVDDAGLWGLGRAFRLERPDLTLQLIERENALSVDRVLLLAQSYSDEMELSIDSSGLVRVPRLRNYAAKNSKDSIKIRSDATYLISGGQGALGQVVAQLLVEKGALYLLLLSRHPKPHDQLPEIEALEKKGIQIVSLACDVSKKEEVAQIGLLIKERGWPSVAGIIHTAGVLTDGTLPSQSAEKIDEAFDAKVEGAKLLHDLIHPSDFIVLFSSAAAAFGSAGQASYSAANTTLDALAQKWVTLQEHALSIQWGAWSDAGMAVRQDAVKRAELMGFGALSHTLGRQILETLFNQGAKGVIYASPIDTHRLASHHPYFAILLAEQKISKKREWTRSTLELFIDNCMAQFISLDQQIDNCSFMEAGFSSLDLVQFRAKLMAELPPFIDLPVHFAFNYPTKQDVLNYLTEQLETSETNEEINNDSTWILLNDQQSGPPLFLIGGVMGTADKTFGTLAASLKRPVYATMPAIPAIINSESMSLEAIASRLKESMLKEVPCERYNIGGLSFGAALAFEMGLQLEKIDKLNRVIMLDPRHMPPFSAPEAPAPFEQLLELYRPTQSITSPVLLFQSQIPPIEKQSEMMREASRSFQSDTAILRNCLALCPNLELIRSDGHHFNLIYKHHSPIASRIEEELSTQEKKSDLAEPIAIIGTACRLPGGVASPDELWEMLTSCKDCVSEVPLSRFDIDEVYDPDPNVLGKSYTRHGAFMEGVENFDHSFFGISAAEATVMDPQQRLLLEVSYQAFHDAGYTKEDLRASPTGVYIGLANDDWTTMGRKEAHSPYFSAGVSGSIASNRISYLLGLTGPSITIDTACSSSLVAVDLAVEKLRAGLCSMALVGGVNVMLHSRMFVSACATKALSPSGRCATFDESADGYCRGEGVGAVILKRLSDAKSDGDSILAIICGTAVNQDGRSVSLTAPNGLAQEAVIRQALDIAKIEGEKIDYVECHGTGTPLGDPIEISALKNVLGRRRTKPLILGAIKTNIGHLEGAAGVIGLIKAVEVVRRREAPGNVHFHKLNPKIDLKGFNATISDHLTSLKDRGDGLLWAGVSSFGFGGTNAHVVLQSYGHSPIQRKPPFQYQPRFLPWNRLPNPLLSRITKHGFITTVSGEKGEIWKDHVIGGKVLIPAASHLTMLGGAVLLNEESVGEDSIGVELSNVVFPRPLSIQESGTVIYCNSTPEGWIIEGEEAGVKERFASCENTRLLSRSDRSLSSINIEQVQERCSSVQIDQFYEALSRQGVHFGPHYRNLHQVYLGSGEAIARIKIELSNPLDRALTLLHPASLDAAIQLLGFYGIKTCGICIPFHLERAHLFSIAEQPTELLAYLEVTSLNGQSIEGTITLISPDGEILAQLQGLTCRQFNVNSQAESSLFITEWIPLRSAYSETNQERSLLLTLQSEDRPLPPNWVKFQVSNEGSLLSAIKNGPWSTIAFLSSGSENELGLGLHLLQLVNSHPEFDLKEIVFLTPSNSIYSAGLWGLARTFRLERPDIPLRSIEYDSDIPPLSLLSAYPQETELSIDSNGLVRVPRLRRYEFIGTKGPIEIRSDATYLISGGQGALGLVAAQFLAEKGARHLLLLSRNPKSHDQFPEIQALGQRGIEIVSLTCDVSDFDQVRQITSWIKDHSWPPLAGIIHTAGILTDSTLSNQSTEKISQAFNAKVNGAQHLHDLLCPSDFILLFSSAAATFGSVGQGSYAAANMALDILAQKWAAAGEQALSIQWGAWSDGGMAVRHNAVKRAASAGFGTISNSLGKEILNFLFTRGAIGTVCASPIDWGQLKLNTPLVSLFLNFSALDRKKEEKSLEPLWNRENLLNLVRKAVSQAIDRPVGDDQPLMANGLDSLGAVLLAQTLSKELDLSLGSVFALNHPTIEEMVNALAALSIKEKALPSTPLFKPSRPSLPQEPIAVIGTACRLPGNVTSPDEFWEMLINGTDCVTEIPLSRFDIDEFYDPDPNVFGKSYTRQGAFIDRAEYFDYEFFDIPAAEADAMDPHQRLLLEVAYQAYYDAGYDKSRLRAHSIGVFIGVANQDWMVFAGAREAHNPYFGTGVSSSIISNRISHILGLTGPSMTIDTACSSSLVALDLAVEKLRNGVCSMALVGGVNVMLHHRTFVGCCAAKMLSRKGRCAAFDESADGYCRGEGVGAVVLKRLSDAESDGDPILAVIRGTAVNQDGLSAALTAPNGGAQEAVISAALNCAEIQGNELDYVECHGTGTTLGDPIEVGAIRAIMGQNRKKPLVLGAVKTNIGHLEGAAGIVGLIKTIEVLRRREAPGNVHFRKLNPKIDLNGFNAVISDRSTSLGDPKDGILWAGVSSFGFGGTNAHVILHSYNHSPSQRKPPFQYQPRFLPWNRLPNPLLSRKTKHGFIASLSGEQGKRWKDHAIGGEVLVPAASHITMLGGSALLDSDLSLSPFGVELSNVTLSRPLTITKIQGMIHSLPNRDGWIIEGEEAGVKECFASCERTRLLSRTDQPLDQVDIEQVKSRCSFVEVGPFYETLSQRDVQFGPQYRNLHEVYLGNGEAIARIKVELLSPLDRALTLLHPASLDGAIQLLGLYGIKTCGICIPFHIQKAQLFTLSEQPSELWAYMERANLNGESAEGTITLFSSSGEFLARLEGLTCRQSKVGSQAENSLFKAEWLPLPKLSTIAITKPSLLLTLQEERRPLPPDWIQLQIDDEESLLSVLKEGSWPTVIFLSSGLEKEIHLGLHLLQLISSHPEFGVKEIVFLTPAGTTYSAGLWGLARTFRLERPDIPLRSIEYDSDIPPLSLLFAYPQETEISIDSSEAIHTLRLNRYEPLNMRKTVEIRSDATYLISGGQGSLGLVAAQFLAEKGARHLLLLSRHPKSHDQIPEIQALEKEGIQIASLSCDVSISDQVNEITSWLKEHSWPSIAGVIHTAGILSDGTLPSQSAEKITQAFSSKVDGARHLHDLLLPSDFIVLFSSAAAIFGSAGQGSYAAANATLDALAQRWAASGEHALSIEWGAWSDGGMAVRHDAVRRAETAGFGTISNSLGKEILDALFMKGATGTVCASPINWSQLKLSSPLVSRFLSSSAPIAKKEEESSQPLWNKESLLKLVRKSVSQAMDRLIEDDQPLMANGLDSLGAVLLAQTLSRELGLSLGSVFALNHPTIEQMAEALMETTQLASPKPPLTKPPTSYRRTDHQEPIAIVGTACRLPGGIFSPDDFWEMLESGKDCVTEVPANRFNIDEVYSPNLDDIGRSYTRHGAFMDEVESFDHEFFGIPIIEARAMDPQQRLLLEVSYEALHVAGYDKENLRNSSVGVFIGQMNYDWAHMQSSQALSNPYFGTGSSAAITSNRISYTLGLTGPSLTIDTACSSSLVAVSLAVEKLLSGECSTALVGGVNVMLSHRSFVGCCAARMLSKKGRCATFDESADGYCRGEGVGAVVLKRLSDAEADGNEILAVIRGTAVNQDGRSSSLTAPNGPAQEAVIQRALHLAGIQGGEVDYVECHGTGTVLGDPIEVLALKAVLRKARSKPVFLGAVKTNIGHTEGAAGIIGLLKAVEVLRHRVAPPIVHLHSINPKIDLSDDSDILLPTQPSPIDASGKRPIIAGVSSFGFGGTNAHVILESWNR